MGVRSSVGRRLSVWKWWEQGAGDTTKLDNWPLTPLHIIDLFHPMQHLKEVLGCFRLLLVLLLRVRVCVCFNLLSDN